jgi:hypothetical protein
VPHEFRRHEPLHRHGWFGHAQRIGDRRQAVTVKRVTVIVRTTGTIAASCEALHLSKTPRRLITGKLGQLPSKTPTN